MILINDTNIWIDLKVANLIKEVFKLSYEIGVPNLLFYDELEELDGELLRQSGIKILEMTESEVLDTAIRSNKTNKVSFNDLTTLVVAKSRNAILVTGDGNLRKIANDEKVKLKGTIWLIDNMIECKIISYKRGAEVCRILLENGRRLPKDELKKRIEKWDDSVNSEVAVEKN